MLKLFFNILFFSTLIISDDNLLLLKSLENNEDWSLIDIRKDSIRVYEKRVDGMDLSALKVEKIIDFTRRYSLVELLIHFVNQWNNSMCSFSCHCRDI